MLANPKKLNFNLNSELIEKNRKIQTSRPSKQGISDRRYFKDDK